MAKGAAVRALPSVCPHMPGEILLPSELRRTHLALVGLHARVRFHMSIEVRSVIKCGSTKFTLSWHLFTCAGTPVASWAQLISARLPVPACTAMKLLRVLVKVILIPTHEVAVRTRDHRTTCKTQMVTLDSQTIPFPITKY